MKKHLSLLLGLGLLLGASQAFADAVVWKTITIPIRTNTINDPLGRGFIDSTQASLGAAATIDTTEGFILPDQYVTADSLTNIYVTVVGSQNFASGESLYIAIDGSSGAGTWTNLNISSCGTCRSGGFGAAGTIVPGTSASSGAVHYNGKASSTSGQVASASGVLGQNNIYGGWWAWPMYRIKVLQTIATANVSQYYTVKVTYQAVQRVLTP